MEKYKKQITNVTDILSSNYTLQKVLSTNDLGAASFVSSFCNKTRRR